MIEIEPGIVKSVSNETLDMTQISMNDKKCLSKLNNLDVFGVFQFETRVAMGIISEIGIDTFEDMYAATTLGRPDPLSCNLHITYGRRKRGEEYWESIPVMADILDQSMGLPIFQESVMFLAQRLAGFNGSEANALRKGLAKGKDNEETMKKLKKIMKEFKERSQVSIEKGLVTSDQLESFVQTLESYGGYGFNKCLSPETVVETENGLKLLSELKIGDNIKAPNTDFSENEFVSVVDIIDSGKKELFEVKLESGQKIKATMDHKFLCNNENIHSLFEIIENNYEIMCGKSMKSQKIISIKSVGEMPTIDITVNNNHHLFYANEGIVTSNSHAVSYAMVAYWCLYLKTYFPVEFMVALLNFTDLAKKDDKGGVALKKYIQYAKKLDVTIAPPNINTSEIKFSLDGTIIRWGLGMIKGLGPKAIAEVIDKKPYDSFLHFLDKVEKRKVNKGKVIALIKCGAFDNFGDREYLINRYLGEIRREKLYEFVPFGDEEKQKTEEELLGMAISFSVLPKDIDYDQLRDEYGILPLSGLEDTESGVFIGKIGNIKKKNSQKSGKLMMLVEIADDFDDKMFFVWEKDIENLEKKLITGHIMTVPLKKFDLDSDGCFYSGPQKDLVDLTEE